MRPHARSAFLAASVLLAAACSFFDPRTPEDPDPHSDIPWIQPTSPANVVTNLENALEGRSISYCMNCCDTSFTFVADPLDVEEYGGSLEFDDWDYYVEQNTLGNIFASVVGSGYPEDSLVSVTMGMVPEYPDPAAPDSVADIWRDYEIVCAGGEWGGWDRPALGRARLTMLEDDFGLWRISAWEDIRPEDYHGDTNRTWGYVKATYR